MADLLGNGGGAGLPTSTEGASAGVEGVSPAKPPRRRPRGARLRRGSRDVKDYPVTEQELWQLGRSGAGATLCFSIASWFLSKSFDLYMQLNTSEVKVEATNNFIRGTQIGFLWAGLVPLAFGIISLVRGGILISQILKETNHYE